MPRGETGQHPGVLLVVCSALFFGVVNGSAVAVVLPEIGADLDIPESHLSWVLGGFLLTYGVAIPFYGRLASRFGARRLFLIGIATFSVGSGLSALASGFEALLAARTVQALGGAAVPGLGMTLASRAFPEGRRGLVLGVVSATMGVAAAVGPLGAGLLSEIGSWRYLFAASSLAVVNVPLGVRFLDRRETLGNEPLGLAGGVLFGMGVAGALLFAAQGSQVGRIDRFALAGGTLSILAFASFGAYQRLAKNPFVPKSLTANRGYLMLTMLGFAITSANLGAQIGLPFLFKSLHGMTTFDIGVALVPAAFATAVVGVLAGRVVDKIGAAVPIRTGAALMIVGAFAVSVWVGTSSRTVVGFAMVLGAGFALVNSPLVTIISRLVDPDDLASALSLNTMMFFVGGSFGTTLFTSIVVNTTPGAGALNPFHSYPGANFSNAFIALVIPTAIGLVLSAALPRGPFDVPGTRPDDAARFTCDCQVPWTPELESARDAGRGR